MASTKHKSAIIKSVQFGLAISQLTAVESAVQRDLAVRSQGIPNHATTTRPRHRRRCYWLPGRMCTVTRLLFKRNGGIPYTRTVTGRGRRIPRDVGGNSKGILETSPAACRENLTGIQQIGVRDTACTRAAATMVHDLYLTKITRAAGIDYIGRANSKCAIYHRH